MTRTSLLCPVLAILSVLLFMTSCASRKDVVYLQDATLGRTSQYQVPLPRIAKGDMLGITVNSKMRELSDPFNLPMVGYYNAYGTTVSNAQQGYIVDEQGQINFPVIGLIPAEGFTRGELAGEIAKRLKSGGYVNDATVSVSLLNFQISVMGEVAKPGRFTVQTDKVSIFDALAMAGDLTIQGRRDNVLVIREVDGQRTVMAHDLRSQEIFASPCYFLRQGDIVYVEPNDIKAQTASINANNNVGTWLSIIGSATSITTLVLTLTRGSGK